MRACVCVSVCVCVCLCGKKFVINFEKEKKCSGSSF